MKRRKTLKEWADSAMAFPPKGKKVFKLERGEIKGGRFIPDGYSVFLCAEEEVAAATKAIGQPISE